MYKSAEVEAIRFDGGLELKAGVFLDLDLDEDGALLLLSGGASGACRTCRVGESGNRKRGKGGSVLVAWYASEKKRGLGAGHQRGGECRMALARQRPAPCKAPRPSLPVSRDTSNLARATL